MPKLFLQEAPQPIASAQASPDAFGAGIGNAMQQVGRSTQILGQVMNEFGDQRARTRAAQYEVELRDTANQIMMHPNIEERVAMFDSAQKSLHDKYRRSSINRQTFDASSGLATGSIRSDFTNQVSQDAVKVAGADLDEEVAIKAAAASDTDDPAEQAAYALEGELAIHNGAERGIVARWDVPKKIESFRNDVRDAVTRRLINDDPAKAIGFLRSGEFNGTVLEREEFEAQALREARVRAQHDRAERGLRIRLDRERERKISRSAESDLFAQFERDGFLPMSDVSARGDELTGTARRRMEILARGPKATAGGGRAERASKLSLYELALGGEDVEEAASEAVAHKHIKPGDRALILAAGEQPAWRNARMQVVEFVKKANTMGPAGADRAIDQFEEWAGAHPDAPSRDAEKAAREIVIEQAKRMPKGTSLIYSVYSEKGTIDVDATLKILDARLERGVMTPNDHNAELQKLMKIDRWQDYRAGLEGE